MSIGRFRVTSFPIALAVAACVLSGPATAACENGEKVVLPKKTEFMVSGVLQKDSNDVTVKLAHSLEVAFSGNLALDAFARTVATTYPGYTLVSTLVTEINTPLQGVDQSRSRTCGGVAI